jgi:tetratricopeptide (TPR) repeat protein
MGLVLPAMLIVAASGCQTDRNGMTVDMSAAIEVYREHVDRRPGRDELDRMIARLPAEQLNDLGVLYEKEGRLEEAAWAYQHAVWRDPRHAQAYVNLGNVLREQGKPQEARLRYRQAMALDPNGFEAANNFADLCAQEGQLLDEAVERLEPLVDEPGPYRPFGLDTLGRLYHLRGEHERALAVLEEALEKAPSHQPALRATIHLHLAETCKALGQLAESESHDAAARRIREQTAPAPSRPDDPESG